MRVLIMLVVILCPLCTRAADGSSAKPETMSLWNGPAPIGDGTTEDVNVRVTLHRPAKPNGTAIVICPGGGYGGLVTGGEGHGIAKWLNGHGITGLVLEYRLPRGRSYVPLLDAQRTIRTARANAKAWNLNPKTIGIIGFSAGGHLASTAATHFDSGVAHSDDRVTRQSSRPDFAILVYPVVTMDKSTHAGSRRNLLGDKPSDELIKLFSNEKQVTAETCPTYLAHALDDRVVVPANSQSFHDALKQLGIATEYLKLPSGGHGLNGYKGPMWDAWQKQSLVWLSRIQAQRP